MGQDVFNSLLYNFNGFPALPIFIGDFLLTQLKEYYFIPVLLAVVILFYQYAVNHSSGSFKPIAIRSGVAISVVYMILNLSMPMDRYIDEILKTQPQVGKVESLGEGRGTIVRTANIQLDVFRDLEHFAIIEMMSSFITFSDLIANNLTRKILYGTTDLSAITTSSELKGYFPSLIYNIKQSRDNQSMKKAETTLNDLQGEIKTSFANYQKTQEEINKELDNFEKELFRAMIAPSLFSASSNLGPNQTSVATGFTRKDNKTKTYFSNPGIELKDIEVLPLTHLSEGQTNIDRIFFYNRMNLIYAGMIAKSNNNLDNEKKLEVGPKYDNYKKMLEIISSLSTDTANNYIQIIYDREHNAKVKEEKNNKKSNKNSDPKKAENKNITEATIALAKYFQSYYFYQTTPSDSKTNKNNKDILHKAHDFIYNIFKNELVALQALYNNDDTIKKFIDTKDNERDTSDLNSLLKDLIKAHSILSSETAIDKFVDGNITNPTIKSFFKIKYDIVLGQIKKASIALISLYDFEKILNDIRYNYNAKINKSNTDTDTLTNINRLREMIDYLGTDKLASIDIIQNYNGFVTNERSTKTTKDEIENMVNYENVLPAFYHNMAKSISHHYQVRKYALNIVQRMADAIADNTSAFDTFDPFKNKKSSYNQNLDIIRANIQQARLNKLGTSHGIDKIRTMQDMFSSFNELRPAGTYPLRGYNRPISWLDLGMFYTVFKTVYETTIRDAFIMNQVGSRSLDSLQSLARSSESASRARVNQTITDFSLFAAGGAAIISGVNTGLKDNGGIIKKLLGGGAEGAATLFKIMWMVFQFMFFMNILLPSGIWFIALMNYFIEISVYLAIAPIAIILMIFRAYQGAIQKYINVLIMLLLYPSVLVSLYFVVLFLDMMLPIMLFSFMPFLNDSGSLASMLSVGFGEGGLGYLGDAMTRLSDQAIIANISSTAGDLVAMVLMAIVTMFLSTYLIFMILRSQSILTQTMQGSGGAMMENQGFSQEAEGKIKQLGRQTGVVGGLGGMAM